MGSVVVGLLVVLCWAPFSQAKLNIVSEFMLDYPVVVGSIFSWQDHFYATTGFENYRNRRNDALPVQLLKFTLQGSLVASLNISSQCTGCSNLQFGYWLSNNGTATLQVSNIPDWNGPKFHTQLIQVDLETFQISAKGPKRTYLSWVGDTLPLMVHNTSTTYASVPINGDVNLLPYDFSNSDLKPTGNPVPLPTHIGNIVTGASPSPDDPFLIALGNGEKYGQLYNISLASGKVSHTLDAFSQFIALTPDSKSVVAISQVRGSATRYTLQIFPTQQPFPSELPAGIEMIGSSALGIMADDQSIFVFLSSPNNNAYSSRFLHFSYSGPSSPPTLVSHEVIEQIFLGSRPDILSGSLLASERTMLLYGRKEATGIPFFLFFVQYE